MMEPTRIFPASIAFRLKRVRVSMRALPERRAAFRLLSRRPHAPPGTGIGRSGGLRACAPRGGSSPRGVRRTGLHRRLLSRRDALLQAVEVVARLALVGFDELLPHGRRE